MTMTETQIAAAPVKNRDRRSPVSEPYEAGVWWRSFSGSLDMKANGRTARVLRESGGYWPSVDLIRVGPHKSRKAAMACAAARLA